MPENTEVTPTGQDGQGVVFNESGEMEFTQAGMDAFKDLLKDSVTDNTQRPVEEEPIEEPEPEETPEVTPEPKRKLKVDGQEIEVTEAELVTLAQQGKDYTKKTQQLAAERDAMAPYDALIRQLNSDPNLSKHIADYWKPQAPAKPQFEDPIEQLKWETKQEALAEFRKEMQQTVVPMQRQQVLNSVKAQVMADPDYNSVHGAIVGYVNSLPPTLRETTRLQLDQDPKTYLELFGQFKAGMAARKKPEPPKEPLEQKRVEKAPILESSNSAPLDTAIKAQKASISKAKAAAMRSGSVDALQEFLEVGGFLSHLK
jgi:hypothetical protein